MECREIRTNLGVQPTVSWPRNYYEFTNGRTLVRVILLGGEFVESIGVVGTELFVKMKKCGRNI